MHQDATVSRPAPGRRFAGKTALSLALFLALSAPASANYQTFLNKLWHDAHARGVPKSVFNEAFRGVKPDRDILPHANNQAEFKETAGAYFTRRVSAARIENGRERAAEWARTLAAIEKRYGVDRYIVLSVWANETNYGGFMGGHSTIEALTSLVYYGYRASYFRKELLNALDILAHRDIDPKHMVGSWAGAMGHTQFMPSSYKHYAVDFDGDGRRDIWTTIPDALASTANYLHRMGWHPGQTWGYEVRALPGFDVKHAARRGTLTIAQWEKLGLRRVEGKGFPRPSDRAHFYQPAGVNGPAFLLLPNFKVIKRYNNSNFYALAVGHLADRIRGGGPFVTPWPPDEALSRKEGKELQALLNRHGFPVGTPDGVVGPQTQDAIRSFQQYAGLEVDGYPTTELIKRLRAID